MYKLAVLRQVYIDMNRILSYISEVLDSPMSADGLTDDFLNAFHHIQEFPYAAEAYFPIEQTEEQYRRKIVRQYWILYQVDDSEQTVTVVRIIHTRQNAFF